MLAGYEKKIFGSEKVWLRKFRRLNNVLHWHDEPEIIYINEGNAVITVEKSQYPATAGQLYIVAPRQLHSVTGEETSVITVFMVERELAEAVALLRPAALPAVKCADVEEYARRILDARARRFPFYDTYINSLTKAMLAELYGGQELVPFSSDEKHDTVLSIFEEISAHYDTVSFTELCKRYYYSPAHFSRMFKRLTTMTFTEYLNRIRVSQAVKLLQLGKTVSETAYACGYNSVRHFDRTFKAVTGYSPGSLPQGYSYMGMARDYTAFDPTDEKSVVLE